MTDIRFRLIKPRKPPKTNIGIPHAFKTMPKEQKLSPSQIKGLDYEKEAAEFLSSQGLQLLEHNLACQLGELDLVMKDGDTLVIVEVKTRKDGHYGGAVASITPAKQYRLQKTVLYFLPYLTQKYFHNKIPFCRFDAYCIQENPYQRDWLKNIFF